ncbi:MAG TPA: glycosyl transferase [Flavobacteriales bacterium]|nr:glycosyl transferase [Flavobacteriales bacterium]
MLSILIPIYNFELDPFVRELREQCLTEKIEFEILCIDDASDQEFKDVNRRLNQLEQVDYEELNSNIGRSKIRNLLAERASYENILFFDCDSSLEGEELIKKYRPFFDQKKVVYGGRSYRRQSPSDPSLMLRWKYGFEREIQSLEQRQEFPYRSFMTNNFLIPKSILSEVQLDEKLKGYGHEDTMLALELKERGYEIIHIDNPLCHIGLEESEEFLSKTKNGVYNLARIIESGKLGPSNKLFRTYTKLRNFKLLKAFQFYYEKNERKFLKNLNSPQPKLKYFDAFKLYHLSKALS